MMSAVCVSVDQISLPLGEIQNFGFGQGSLWVSSPRRMIVDLLWPLAQRGPDQNGHFDWNLIGCNDNIPPRAGYGLNMTPNKTHMLLSVKTDFLMDMEKNGGQGSWSERLLISLWWLNKKNGIAMCLLGFLHTVPPSEVPYAELSPPKSPLVSELTYPVVECCSQFLPSHPCTLSTRH